MRFWTLIALILVLSAVGLTYEIAAGRVLAPFFGTSLLTWTTVIAVVLAGFSLGSALGGLVAERPRPAAMGQVRGCLVATAVLMALSPTLLGFLTAMGLRGTGGMVAATILTFFPASVLVTLPSPLLAKLAIEARPGREGSSLGIVMAAGSAGAIFGSVASGFVLLPLLGSAATFAACGALTLACLPVLRGASGPPAGIVAGAAGFTLLTAVAGGSVCTYESGLSCLRTVERGAEIRLISDGTTQAAESTAPGEDFLPLSYTRWLWARMNADLGPTPDVLFVGGGGYSLPTRLLEDRPGARATAVEIDPLVTQVVRETLPRAGAMIEAEGGSRLSIVHADGRVFINDTEARFDAAVMDAFSSSSIPAHLVTTETFERLREIVDGPVYVNLIDTPDGPLARGVHAILAGLWPNVVAVQGELSPRGRTNILLAASDAPLAPAPGAPGDYEIAAIPPARAFTDDRGWTGHR